MSAGAQLLVSIQQQDAILGHDANHHDQAHEAGHIEIRARDEQGEHHPRKREDGTGQDGNRSGEVAELRQQNAENQGQRQHQHAGQIGKRALLLLIGAAIFNPNRCGKLKPAHRSL